MDQQSSEDQRYQSKPTRKRRQRSRSAAGFSNLRADVRKPCYSILKNNLIRQPAFSEDRLENLHQTALRVLEELGIRVLHKDARNRFAIAGADIDQTNEIVKIDRNLIEMALEAAPSEFMLHGATPEKSVTIGGNNTVFSPVIGPPYVSDLDFGRRTATLEDTQKFIKLSEYFDIIHVQSTNVEAQDIPREFRHLKTTESQLLLSRKPTFIYARGSPQVRDGLEMVRIARGLKEKKFKSQAFCYTSINTNSPRQLDIPMCQGIIDFAEAGQMLIITPFTLAGAMAPINLSSALVLQHAEALAGITLAQIVQPGTPVVYGSFTSNVDMKTGSPAFGTPEFFHAALGAGQLARHINLPWRGSAATSANTTDAQSAYETLTSAWGTLLGGANFMMHAAGWLEGGLTGSLEKFIMDVELLQIFGEIFQRQQTNDPETAYEAIASIEPGGHFFGSDHTLSCYKTEFYEPLVSDWSNFGSWSEAGSKTTPEIANAAWKRVLNEFQAPRMHEAQAEELSDFVNSRTLEGGALPES
mgnify:FL=1